MSVVPVRHTPARQSPDSEIPFSSTASTHSPVPMSAVRNSPVRKSPVRKSVREIDTAVGMARAHLWRPSHPLGALVLGHGAGGSSWSGDLEVLTTLGELGWWVVLVEQPWRVAGRKVAAPPAQLDVAWLAVLEALTSGRGGLPRPWVFGGRSAGARVACRTARALRADGVLALSFPLHPPGRPEKSRAGEAAMVTDAGTRLFVIQGERDPFGSPAEVREALGAAVEVVEVRGTHSFTKTPTDVLAAAVAFLATLQCRGASVRLTSDSQT